jgi:hypothetical protein
MTRTLSLTVNVHEMPMAAGGVLIRQGERADRFCAGRRCMGAS